MISSRTGAVTCPIVVLDTNVVLDWLVFRDSRCAALGEALAAGSVQWCASAAMREELAHVLGRGVAQAWRPDFAALWAQWQRNCVELPTPGPWPPATQLRCTDVDDQMFIDFSLVHGARFLLSRDRAVLKLARRASRLGLSIMTPSDWAAARSAAA